VPGWAVGLLAAVLSAVTALAVHFVSDQFQMIAVHAWAIAAEMVRLKTARHRAALHEPSRARVAHILALDLESSVPIVELTCPLPAAVWQHADVTHESL
jgi:hypothetical protein